MFDPQTQVVLVSIISTLATSAGISVTAYRVHKRNRPQLFNPWGDALERDEYGYLVKLNWLSVMLLEHDMGYPHVDESKKFCDRPTCREEIEDPVYEVHNGFLAVKSWPELPEIKPTHDEHGRLLPTGSVWGGVDGAKGEDGDAVITPLTQEENVDRLNRKIDEIMTVPGPTLKDKYQEIKNSTGYFPGGMTINELRAMPEEPRAFEREMDKLRRYIIEGFKTHDFIALPEGHQVSYRYGGEMAQIETPSGMTLLIHIEDMRKEAADARRRDEDLLFKHALESFKAYSYPDDGGPKELQGVEPDLTPENRLGRGVDTREGIVQS
jgi:hypothetical protein